MSDYKIPYLRTHSYYGFHESLLSPADLVRTAKNTDIHVLGLTDFRFLTGAVEFYEECIKADIKPIIGLEINLKNRGIQGKLALLAKNFEGWSNLCRLSTLALVEQKTADLGILDQHRDGLIALEGDPNGVLRKLILNEKQIENPASAFLQDIKSIFSEDLFIEIHRDSSGPLKNEQALIDISRELELPLLAAQNIFYENKSEQTIYQTLTAIKHNHPIHTLPKSLLPRSSAHFPTLKSFTYRYQDLPEALENLNEINERCTFNLPIGQTHYPTFPTPDGETQSEFLRKRAFAGAQKRYHILTEDINQRLDHELDIISSMGYDPIFLIVEDILNHARELGIPTSSRGSAASSLVAHCLNITSPDPLALNLYFERFLNPARKKPPDIDTDIASDRREEVIQYVFDTYGKDRVAMVGTINRYRPKSAFGDVAKAYGLSPENIRQLSNKLPSSFRFHRGEDSYDPFSPLLKETTISIIKDIIADAKKILDLPRHLSVHPGGIIIAPFPITNLIPLVYSASLNINHAQFDLEGVEKLGMVKIDLLGIRGLAVLGEVANQIHDWHIKEFHDGLSVLDSIPDDDIATTELVAEGKTIGCFQIESPGMRTTLQEINARSPEDIMAALALYRPGPLRGGLRDAFVRRFRGEEQVTHIHNSLTNLLSDTLGVILYQEQVLRIAHELGGLSIAQADILRRAMSHFNPGGVMDTLKENFIQGASQNQNVPLETAERIWEMMAAFAGYGFPKAHAASYAQLAWNSAWCKAHYPAEFMAAVLGFGGGYYSQRVYLMEARRLNLNINPPHINHAKLRFCVKYPKGVPTLFMGFDQVRDLTQKTIQMILQSQPFNSLEDFLLRVDPRKKEAENLIKCGALDGLCTIPEGLHRINHKRTPGQMHLFTTTTKAEDWDISRRLAAQQDILGTSLTMTPLEKFAQELQRSGAISTLKAHHRIGERVRVAGMRQTLRRFRTRSKEMMCFLNLEDIDGSLQILISPALYRKYYSELQETGPFLIEGVMEEGRDHAHTRMQAEKITLIK